jgi:TRAP-type C4-dicarboxylate transport system permease large subunit
MAGFIAGAAGALYVLGAIVMALFVMIWVRDNRPDVQNTARTHALTIVAMVIWPLIPLIIIWMMLRDWNKKEGEA